MESIFNKISERLAVLVRSTEPKRRITQAEVKKLHPESTFYEVKSPRDLPFAIACVLRSQQAPSVDENGDPLTVTFAVESSALYVGTNPYDGLIAGFSGNNLEKSTFVKYDTDLWNYGPTIISPVGAIELHSVLIVEKLD